MVIKILLRDINNLTNCVMKAVAGLLRRVLEIIIILNMTKVKLMTQEVSNSSNAHHLYFMSSITILFEIQIIDEISSQNLTHNAGNVTLPILLPCSTSFLSLVCCFGFALFYQSTNLKP